MPNDVEPGPVAPATGASDQTPEYTDQQIVWGVPSGPDCGPESRWPPVIAVLAVIVMDHFAPHHLAQIPKWVYPAVLTVLLILLVAGVWLKHSRLSVWARYVSMVILGVMTMANVVALMLFLDPILDSEAPWSGHRLIFGSLYIWVINVIVLSVWYWLLDRGGPHARHELTHRAPDLLFPEMASPGSAKNNWTPAYFDYLYVSLTNAMAFSPADTLPLTKKCKALMGAQSLISLLTVTIVAARAINILNGSSSS